MTKAYRLCIKIALVPTATFVVGLLSFMALRAASGISPLPTGATQYVTSASLLMTFGAIVAANLLRVRLNR